MTTYEKIEIDGVAYWLVPVATPTAQTTWAQCGLDGRFANPLIVAGVTHLEQVFEMTEGELLREPGVGRKTLLKIRELLEERYPHYRIGQNRKK